MIIHKYEYQRDSYVKRYDVKQLVNVLLVFMYSFNSIKVRAHMNSTSKVSGRPTPPPPCSFNSMSSFIKKKKILVFDISNVYEKIIFKLDKQNLKKIKIKSNK